jgi:hypothetical protein
MIAHHSPVRVRAYAFSFLPEVIENRDERGHSQAKYNDPRHVPEYCPDSRLGHHGLTSQHANTENGNVEEKPVAL